jgi:SAM-dependent methyltransferase/uncharacterized protein YbaR (Trm112 family)
MRTTAIHILRCPFCAGSLELRAGAKEDELGVSFGVTRCGSCGYEFPIVGGVLIIAEPGQLIGVEAEAPAFRSGRGVAARSLCRLIAARRYTEAFSRLLNPATPNADLLVSPRSGAGTTGPVGHSDMTRPDPHRTTRVSRDLQARLNRLSGGRLLLRARRRIGEFLLENREELTALEAMDLYMAQYSGAETAVHFAFGFGQPRHLAALSVASLIKERGGPILDLACGPGHLTHYFCTGEHKGRSVVGVDRNFFRLWVARNFMAPGASFVCQWIDRPLPFSTGYFDSAFCSDAFHLVLNKAGCVREARRVTAPDGLIGIVRFGNAALEPREGHELTVDGYTNLFSDVSKVLLGEGELVASYRGREGPDLRRSGVRRELVSQKWLSAVLSDTEAVFRNHGPVDGWHHAEGRLALNPIYRLESADAEGNVTLRFEFPTEWYEFENAGYLEYAPESVTVSREVLADVRSGSPTDAVRELIDRFVVVGVPDRYMQER